MIIINDEPSRSTTRLEAEKCFKATLARRLENSKDAPIVGIFSELHKEDSDDEEQK